jgi:hypothetical protein
VVALVRGCPQLTTVDLKVCHQLTDASVVALAEHCPRLSIANLNPYVP